MGIAELYRQAKEDPQRRQAFLNRMAVEFSDPTVKDIRYLHHPEIARGTLCILTGIPQDDDVETDATSAFVDWPIQTFGNGDPQTIYVLPNLFRHPFCDTNALLRHEQQHTRDASRGIRTALGTVDWTCAGYFQTPTLGALIEARAYMRQLERMWEYGGGDSDLTEVAMSHLLWHYTVLRDHEKISGLEEEICESQAEICDRWFWSASGGSSIESFMKENSIRFERKP